MNAGELPRERDLQPFVVGQLNDWYYKRLKEGYDEEAQNKAVQAAHNLLSHPEIEFSVAFNLLLSLPRDVFLSRRRNKTFITDLFYAPERFIDRLDDTDSTTLENYLNELLEIGPLMDFVSRNSSIAMHTFPRGLTYEQIDSAFRDTFESPNEFSQFCSNYLEVIAKGYAFNLSRGQDFETVARDTYFYRLILPVIHERVLEPVYN